jgi:hypothetical protein
MYALAGDTVMQEGQPGRELYMLMNGELEVFQNANDDSVPGAPRKVSPSVPPPAAFWPLVFKQYTDGFLRCVCRGSASDF